MARSLKFRHHKLGERSDQQRQRFWRLGSCVGEFQTQMRLLLQGNHRAPVVRFGNLEIFTSFGRARKCKGGRKGGLAPSSKTPMHMKIAPSAPLVKPDLIGAITNTGGGAFVGRAACFSSNKSPTQDELLEPEVREKYKQSDQVVSQPHETLELRLTDEQIAAIRRRIARRKRKSVEYGRVDLRGNQRDRGFEMPSSGS